MKKARLVFWLIIGTLYSLQAQEKRAVLSPYLSYQGFFDNREFFQVGLQPSTYFGQRISPGLTTTLDSANQLVVAVNFLQEFGNPRLVSSWQPEVFFKHHGQNTQLVFGAFPREKWADTLSLAIFSDSLRYTRPNATGFSIRNERKRGHSSVWLDWSGQKTAVLREQFFIGTVHEGQWKNFNWRIEGSLTHIAKSLEPPPEQFIEEQSTWLVQGGRNFHSSLGTIQLRVGWLGSWERIRDGSPIQSPESLWLFGQYQYKRWDIQHTRKHGQAHHVVQGDAFYRFRDYHRTDLRYMLEQRGRWKIEGVYTLHRADQVWSHQQRLLIRFDW